MRYCERGRVAHGATHEEVVKVVDGGESYTDRTLVCRDHFMSKGEYARVGEGSQEVKSVTRRQL